MRRRLLIALAVTAAGSVAMAGCDPSPPEVGPSGAPSAGGVRQPSWSTPLPAELGKPLRGAFAGASVIVQTERGVAGLARDGGALRWRRVAAGTGPADSTVIVGTAGVVFVDRTRREASMLDPDTGAVRATVLAGGAVADLAASATMLFTVQRAAPTSRITAYELATGKRLWASGYPDEVRLAVPGDPAATGYLNPDGAPVNSLAAAPANTLVVSARSGSGWTTGTVAADTGKPAGTPAAGPLTLDRGQRAVSPASVLSWDPEQPQCALPVTGYDPATGRELWKATVGQWQPVRTGDEPKCGAPWRPVFAGDRVLALTGDERPQVLDAVTGKPAWTGEPGGYPLALAGTIVLTRADHALGDLVAYDTGTGQKRWQAALGPADRQPLSRANVEYAVVGETFVVAGAQAEKSGAVTRKLTAYAAATGRPEWTSTGSVHLLGAGQPGAIAGQYPENVIGEGLSTEVRLYPF